MSKSLLPLYGVLQGDTIVLLILAYESETVSELIEKLVRSARTRVAAGKNLGLYYKEKFLSPSLTLKQAGFEALDRFDVIDKDEIR